MTAGEQQSELIVARSTDDVRPSVPAVDEGQQVDIHVPKPWHGFREFLKEYGIIVLGVLTALGAEQAVETAHWNAEVDDARAALRVELNHDLGIAAYRLDRQACIDRRLDDVDAWLTRLRANRPITLTGPIGGPGGFSFRSSVWEIVKTGQVAAHMSLPDKVAYAETYDVLHNISDIQANERDTWRTLANVDGALSLDDAEQRRVRSAIRILRGSAKTYANNLDDMAGSVARLGLKPDRLKDFNVERTRAFCKSILPKED